MEAHVSPLEPTPAVTVGPRGQPLPQAAAYGLALSLSLASTSSYSDLHTRITLQPGNVVSSRTTHVTSLVQDVLVAPAANPLAFLIKRIHAKIPDEAWAKIPHTNADQIDRYVYHP